MLNLVDPRTLRSSFISNKPTANSRVTKASDIYTYLRGAPIPPIALGKRVAVYNGFTFVSFIVKRWMLGKKFGVFARTKKLGRAIHEAKNKGKKKTKKK